MFDIATVVFWGYVGFWWTENWFPI